MTLDVEAIQKRLAAASPGPWHDCDHDLVHSRGGFEDTVAKVRGPGFEIYLQSTDRRGEGKLMENAEFMAGARADVEALLADNDRLRKLIADAETSGCKCGPAAENTGCPWCKAQLVFDGSDRSPTDTRAVGYLPLEHEPDCPAFSAPGVVR